MKVCTFNTVYCFQLLDMAERMAVNVQGTVFTLARLKIVPTIKNLYHTQCQCVDELSSLV